MYTAKNFNQQLKPIGCEVQILWTNQGKKFRIVHKKSLGILYNWNYGEDIQKIINKLLTLSSENIEKLRLMFNSGQAIDNLVQVEINVAGHKNLYTMFPCGEGNYPYVCGDSQKYPNDEVYYENPNGTGTWLTLREYELGNDGVYRLPFALI